MSLDTFQQLHQDKVQDSDFEAHLKEKPYQATEYKNMVLNGSISSEKKAEMMGKMGEYRAKGFIVDDHENAIKEANQPRHRSVIHKRRWK